MTSKSPQAETPYYLGRMHDLRATEGRYEFSAVEPLTEAQFRDITAAYARVRTYNHPAMLELLAGMLEEFSAHTADAVEQVRDELMTQEDYREINLKSKSSVFAMANAVYSFQEHTETLVRRRSGEKACAAVHRAFGVAYDTNVMFDTAYRLRRQLTHEGLGAIQTAVNRNLLGTKMQQVSVDVRLRREELSTRGMGAALRAKLAKLDEDPPMTTIFTKALQAASTMRPALKQYEYPESAADLRLLLPWRNLFMSNTGIQIHDMSDRTHARVMAIDAQELRLLGMT